MTVARIAERGATAVADALAGRAKAIAARTSGSTGEPREVLLGADALAASAQASLERLGGPGAWLLALPEDRIAGAMVVARSLVADAPLERLPSGPFTAGAFAAAAQALPTGQRYVSLVPTQVRRLLADARGRAALETFDAVLVGGAAPGMALPDNAVETYGMTETCGGCVYDGVPLSGVRVATEDDGRILLAGPMLASGYADGDDAAFVFQGGLRWFRTSDLGTWDGDRLRVLGRADDVIISGGLNVHPAAVERALMALPGVADAAVAGVPDAEWGEAVAAVVALDPTRASDLGSPQELADQLGLARHERPRFVLAVDAVPRTEAGKIDRRAARAIVARAVEEAR